ncbi:MAG: hypothetical protein JWN44_2422 [Myxococcales bacterium]|nr:hypothetical protein [Myxococcales bacterium]
MRRTEFQEGNVVELRGDDGTRFVVTRLKPGLLLVVIAGDDRGALGPAPFVEIEREMARSQPLELFMDLRDAAGAAPEVREAWTAWFQRQQVRLERVSILASSRFINLAVEIAKLFSRTGNLIQIYSDQRLFEQALTVARGAVVTLAPSLLPAMPPVPALARRDIEREVLTDRSVRLRSANCSWIFERLRPGVLLVTVNGHDHGEFGTATLDEVSTAMGLRPLALFVDARLSPSASTAASEPWTAWFTANRAGLKRVTVLTAARALRLTLAISSHLSRIDDLMRITDDAHEFEAAVAAEAPGFALS